MMDLGQIVLDELSAAAAKAEAREALRRQLHGPTVVPPRSVTRAHPMLRLRAAENEKKP